MISYKVKQQYPPKDDDILQCQTKQYPSKDIDILQGQKKNNICQMIMISYKDKTKTISTKG
jgi:hypothetical protein